VSTVEQRGAVKPGRVRRLVTRALLVLGGAAAATAAAWAIGAASAAADQLPLPVDSLGGVAGCGIGSSVGSSAVSSGTPAVDPHTTLDAATGALAPVARGTLSAMRAGAPPRPQLPPPPAGLAAVTEQVRSTVLGVGAGLVPSWTAARGLLAAPVTPIGSDVPPVVTPQVAAPPVPGPRIDQPRQGPLPVGIPVVTARGPHHGSVFPRVGSGDPADERTTDPGHGFPPAVPFAPPTGSADTGGHLGGGLAGGPGVGMSVVAIPAGVIFPPGDAPGATPD
jgi:hypothetical protein